MRTLTLFSLLSLFSFNSYAAKTHALLSDAPRDYTKKIEATVENYKDVKIKDRCGDGDGPQEIGTHLNVKGPDVVAFDAWTNEGKSLMERVVYRDKNTEGFLSLDQRGCSHTGWEYTIVVSEKLQIKDIPGSVKKGLALLKLGEKKGIFVSKNLLAPKALQTATARFSRQKSACKNDQGRILCEVHEDPENYELVINEVSGGRTQVSLHYWFVL